MCVFVHAGKSMEEEQEVIIEGNNFCTPFGWDSTIPCRVAVEQMH